MKAMKLAPIAMFLALILGTLPAAAEHRSHEREDVGLERLSHKLAKATEELRDEVAESRRGWRFHKRYTLRKLNRLEHDAKVFHRRVERQGVYDRDTRRAFRDLEASFAEASDRFPAMKARRGIRRDFSQVVALMDEVETRMARINHRRDDRRHARHHRHDSWRVANNFGF